jgi:hypothetical protein
VQRLHPAIQHLRKAREFADVLYRQTDIAKRLRRSASRNKFHSMAGQLLGKLNKTGLIRN